MNLFLGYSGTPPANMVRWGQTKYKKQYLTIEPLSTETLNADKTSIALVNDYGPSLTGTFEAKLNDGDWTTISWENVSQEAIGYNLVKVCDPSKDTISYGEKLQIRGLDTWLSSMSLKVTCDGGAKVYGKIADSLTPEYAASTTSAKLASFFSGSTGLKDASELDLHDGITLTDSCYYQMFNFCTSLVNAPQLPATALADSCYSGMFFRCTSLVKAPELPATSLADSCYYQMFNLCSSLVNAPQLPATTLANNCYKWMFQSCTKVAELHYPASIENDSTFKGMSGSPKFGATNATVIYDL